MKTRLFLLFAAVLMAFATGCATSSATFNPSSRSAVGEIDIRSAVFGSGMNTADVTEQVIGLLRKDRAGFIARGDILGTDPLPYAAKALVVDYYYKGTPHRYFVANQQHISYDLLVQNATRKK